MSNSLCQTGARRFAFTACGLISYYLTCNLDEGVLRFWPGTAVGPYGSLVFSPSIEERKLARWAKQLKAETGKCLGVKLTDSQIAHIESLVTKDQIESMRGVDDDSMRGRTGSLCYRDGWQVSFYAEGDSGWPPLHIKNLVYTSFSDDMLPFEQLEIYIESEVLSSQFESSLCNVSHKKNPKDTKRIIDMAILAGFGAMEEILWYGNSKLLKQLDGTDLPQELSYSVSGDSLTIRYGNTISREYGVLSPPACERVFGREHIFGHRG